MNNHWMKETEVKCCCDSISKTQTWLLVILWNRPFIFGILLHSLFLYWTPGFHSCTHCAPNTIHYFWQPQTECSFSVFLDSSSSVYLSGESNPYGVLSLWLFHPTVVTYTLSLAKLEYSHDFTLYAEVFQKPVFPFLTSFLSIKLKLWIHSQA